MRKFEEPEILAPAARWRLRAKDFMREAREAKNVSDTARLAGMASSMNYAATDLCVQAGVDPNDVPQPVNPEADQQLRVADEMFDSSQEGQS